MLHSEVLGLIKDTRVKVGAVERVKGGLRYNVIDKRRKPGEEGHMGTIVVTQKELEAEGKTNVNTVLKPANPFTMKARA